MVHHCQTFKSAINVPNLRITNPSSRLTNFSIKVLSAYYAFTFFNFSINFIHSRHAHAPVAFIIHEILPNPIVKFY